MSCVFLYFFDDFELGPFVAELPSQPFSVRCPLFSSLEYNFIFHTYCGFTRAVLVLIKMIVMFKNHFHKIFHRLVDVVFSFNINKLSLPCHLRAFLLAILCPFYLYIIICLSLMSISSFYVPVSFDQCLKIKCNFITSL